MAKTERSTSKKSRTPPEKAGEGSVKREFKHRWTFLSNHSHVLILIYAHPDIVLREVAAAVGITERAVQQIILDLEEDGFIERQCVGRQNKYRVIANNSLRHPIESHCKAADLIRLILEHPKAGQNALIQ